MLFLTHYLDYWFLFGIDGNRRIHNLWFGCPFMIFVFRMGAVGLALKLRGGLGR